MRPSRLFLLLGLGILAAGCGGGGGGSSSSGPEAGAPFEFGNLVGRAAATNPPLTTNSDKVVATALAGNITALRLRDQIPSPEEQRVALGTVVDADGDWELATVGLDGKDFVKITNNNFYEAELSASPDGRRLAFISGRDGNNEVYMCNIDGTGVVRLTNTPTGEGWPSWSPDSTAVIYGNGDGNLMKVNVATPLTQVMVLDNADYNAFPAYSPDGLYVYFITGTNLRSLRLSDSAITTVHGGGSSITFIRVSPTAPEVFFREGTNLKRKVIGGPVADLGPGYHFDVSQDGSRLVCSSGIGLANFMVNRDGTGTSPLPFVGNNVAWIPAPRDRQFIGGAGPLLGTDASGFIVGRSGVTVRGIVAWDATTPSSVVITKQTGADTNSPNLVFSVDADNITYINYANNAYFKKIAVVGAGLGVVSANGALIDLDSETGKVTAVLPFSGSRSSRKYSESGRTRTFEGTFLGVFDAEGNNLAPNGASSVRISPDNQITVN